MTVVVDSVLPPCADAPDVFLDVHLQSPPARSTLNAAARRQLEAKKAAAHRRCAGCPVFVDCLFRAVVEVDVSGYVACTTETDRRAMRRRLGVQVVETEAGAFGAPRSGVGPVDHATVLATRSAHPDDTCAQLADRLGCSTSTIKRHLRRAREQRADTTAHTAPTSTRPTVDAVLDAFDQLESSARVA